MADYLASIERAGGIPVEIDAERMADVPALPDTVDAVILTGGGDMDPALYGQAPHALTRMVPAERDQFELAVARMCLTWGLPLLAICRGVQVMNVACGGTLVQDIPSDVREAAPHVDVTTPTACPHVIDVVPGSLLARCLANEHPSLQAVPVNSRHHQAVKEVGSGLRVTARARDGVVEAVEFLTHPFAIGVQWHPENFVQSGEFLGLFSACLSAAAAWRRRRSG
ncbi:MAG: gamma-glutamyl-gamma-aminobutyrate hydrolase family protein [Acidobacteria bacterium]|nr:gamma-glutamyl-gamma-aminobutyrate hydrolase family protein [Acidobacteriota bacterium]